MDLQCSLSLVLTIGLFVTATQTQSSRKAQVQEQSKFSAEQDDAGVPVLRPVSVPKGALEILAKDERVLQCMENKELPSVRISAKWFIASEIHLDGSNEVDLIVQPRFLKVGSAENPTENACLMGANIDPFWVFRKTSQGFQLVLSESAHDLEVLGTKWNGFREIRLYSMTAETISTSEYRFDGKQYRRYRTKSEAIQ